MHDQLQIVQNVTSKIHAIPGARGRELQTKTNSVFTKNEGLKTLEQLNDAVNDGVSTGVAVSPAIGSAYAYAPIVSVDVERSFSDYKLIFSDRRQSFTEDNMEKHIIVMFNSRFLK